MSDDLHQTLRSDDGRLTIELAGRSEELLDRQLLLLAQSVIATFPELAGDQGIELGVTWTTPQTMQARNLEYRGVDEPTDVLSFPADGLDEVPLEMPRELGDLVLCESEIAERLSSGTTMVREDADLLAAVRRCVVHGMLHLLGYDHDSSDAEAVMFGLEDSILIASSNDEVVLPTLSFPEPGPGGLA